MNKTIEHALTYYDLNIRDMQALNAGGNAFKLIDSDGIYYFLKIYRSNACGDINGENVYNMHGQVEYESAILRLLSNTELETANPRKNIAGRLVTELERCSDGSSISVMITSFIEGIVSGPSDTPTVEMAYFAGVSAAQFHLASKKKLLPIAVKRPHKRQDFIGFLRDRIAQGIVIGSLTSEQFNMLDQCCDIIIDCMNSLDTDPDNNTGLVHTDMRNTNIIYARDRAILIDFSRSVYSYFLYDLAEMILHADFGGSSPDLQIAILRGYYSVKPLTEYHMFATQVMFVMFILTIMASTIEQKENSWLESVLRWFANDVHPGLISGKGYMDKSIFDAGVLSSLRTPPSPSLRT
jgi:Ser/Thr protein kinase RdoA (MazF antagonist)